MKTTIQIKGISEEKGKESGKTYWKVQTEVGNMTVWMPTAAELQKYIGKTVEVEVQKSGDFTNIKKFYRVVESNEDDENVENVRDVEKDAGKIFGAARREKNRSMYVSYAKDVFMLLRSREKNKQIVDIPLMETAIQLVKQAIEEF